MSTQFYDFTLQANGSQTILAEGAYFKILSSTGILDAQLSDGSRYGRIGAGQGARNKDFKRITLRDVTGAPNSGIIIISDADFVDDQLAFTAAALAALSRPEASSVNFKQQAAAAANTPVALLAPGSNTGGAVVLSAYAELNNATNAVAGVMIAKATAPATILDGEIIWGIPQIGNFSATWISAGNLPAPVIVPAGLGIYIISGSGFNVNSIITARFKVL